MLQNMAPFMSDYGSYYSNWAKLMLSQTFPFYEIAVSGENFRGSVEKMNNTYLPNALYIASKSESEMALLQNKYVKGKTMIYVCVNKSCQLPVENYSEALSQIKYR